MFALLAVVTATDVPRMVWVWWVFASLAAVLPVVSFVEQRRRVSLVRDLCTRREELLAAGIPRDGDVLHADTELRSYPIQISFPLIVTFGICTCPSPRASNLARGLAITMNVVMGWWSLEGLLRTPANLWQCLRGGVAITPRALIALVDAEPAPDVRRELIVAARLVGAVIGVLAALFAACAVVVHFMLKWRLTSVDPFGDSGRSSYKSPRPPTPANVAVRDQPTRWPRRGGRST